jgi:hypothetical protein
VGTIEIGRIDVTHAARDGLSQKRDRRIDIARRSPYKSVTIAACELHGTVAHAVHRHRRAWQGEAAGSINPFNAPPELFVVCSEEN